MNIGRLHTSTRDRGAWPTLILTRRPLQKVCCFTITIMGGFGVYAWYSPPDAEIYPRFTGTVLHQYPVVGCSGILYTVWIQYGSTVTGIRCTFSRVSTRNKSSFGHTKHFGLYSIPRLNACLPSTPCLGASLRCAGWVTTHRQLVCVIPALFIICASSSSQKADVAWRRSP